jgi:outer membrane protein assembly factor BamB
MKINHVRNIIYKDDIELCKFRFDIADVKVSVSRMIVLLKSPEGSFFNENIFCINENGELIWQIESISHFYDDSPYDRISIISDNTIEAWNYDSINYFVDINTGKILSKKFTK